MERETQNLQEQNDVDEKGMGCEIDSNMDSDDVKHMEKAKLVEEELTE